MLGTLATLAIPLLISVVHALNLMNGLNGICAGHRTELQDECLKLEPLNLNRKINMKAIRDSDIQELTPEMLAKAFWEMHSDKQADFFDALAVEIAKCQEAYSYGEMQWCYLHSDLRERKSEGFKVLLSMSAFSFEFAQDNCGLQQRNFTS